MYTFCAPFDDTVDTADRTDATTSRSYGVHSTTSRSSDGASDGASDSASDTASDGRDRMYTFWAPFDNRLVVIPMPYAKPSPSIWGHTGIYVRSYVSVSVPAAAAVWPQLRAPFVKADRSVYV